MRKILTLSLLTLSTVSLAAAKPTFKACKAADFVAIETDTVDIKTGPSEYTPKCITVKAGTSIQIQASGMHPFNAAADIDEVKNPFAANNGSQQNVTQVLRDVGSYGYFCTKHGAASGTGMAGMIVVTK